MRYLYLHGFASSPDSRKAHAFATTLRGRGIELEIPALDGGDFECMTITSQLSVIGEHLKGAPVRLVGSSMGGYLAGLYATAHPEVERLVLLAPAFHFGARWREIAGPERIRQWEESGCLDVFHHGSRCERRIGYQLYTDALQHPPEPNFHQPALIFHGRHDDLVPVQLSRAFANEHANAVLREMDSDHGLLNVLDDIIGAAAPFLTG